MRAHVGPRAEPQAGEVRDHRPGGDERGHASGKVAVPGVVGPHGHVQVQPPAADHQLQLGRARVVAEAVDVQVAGRVPDLDHGLPGVAVEHDTLDGALELGQDARAVRRVELPAVHEAREVRADLAHGPGVGEPAHELERLAGGHAEVELAPDAGRQALGRVLEHEVVVQHLERVQAARRDLGTVVEDHAQTLQVAVAEVVADDGRVPHESLLAGSVGPKCWAMSVPATAWARTPGYSRRRA